MTTKGEDGKSKDRVDHAEKRRGKPPEKRARRSGTLAVRLQEGSVFPQPPDNKLVMKDITAPGQRFRVTIFLAEDVAELEKAAKKDKKPKLKKRYKKIAATATATFKSLPVGRYIVVVENVSSAPRTPGAVAEVTVRPSIKYSPPAGLGQAAAKPAASPPTECIVLLSSDTPGAIARGCQFHVGALEGIPERGGVGLWDRYSKFFNARVLPSFWSSWRDRLVPAPPMPGNGGVVVLQAGTSVQQTPANRTSWEGVPTAAPPFGSPSLTMMVFPGQSVPTNLMIIRDDTGMPVLVNNKEVFGLLQAEADPGPSGMRPFNDTDCRAQITFVTRKDGGGEFDFEILTGGMPAVAIRYLRYHSPIGAAQHTPVVWKSPDNKPPEGHYDNDYKNPPFKPGEAVTTQAKRRKRIELVGQFAEKFLQLHKKDPGEERQHVVVNEALFSKLGNTRLGKSQKVTKLLKAREKSVKALFKAINTTRIPEAVLNKWLAQQETAKETDPEKQRWISAMGPSIDYAVRSLAAAAIGDPGAIIILNEHSLESIDSAKGLAHAVLTRELKRRLRKAKQNAAARLAVGFQMHLKDHFYAAEKKRGFLEGLRRTMAYYKMAKTRVYITEMAIRMPGFAGVERKVKKLQLGYALRKLLQELPVIQPGDGFVTVHQANPPPGIDSLTLKVKPDMDLTVDLKTGKISDPDGKPIGLTMPPAGADGPAMEAWLKANPAKKEEDEWVKALVKALRVDRRFVNINEYGGDYNSIADGILERHKVPVAQKRQQAELFYKVVRTCLSSPVCNDLNFWGLTDHARNDPQDLFGFLFSKVTQPDPGIGPEAFPQAIEDAFLNARKATYFAVVQAMVEAAVARNRHSIEPYAKACGRTSRTRGNHTYEEYLAR